MQMISGSVGENGTNNINDVALVQAILVKTQGPATRTAQATPYLARIDGDCGPRTKNAIRAFQNDHVFVSPAGTQSMANPNATAGLVAPGDATWRQLLEKVPRDFADMRVLIGGKTVYLAATSAQLQSKVASANGLTFDLPFRAKVTACINKVHTLYGIAVGVCTQGDRRNFQTQYDLLTSGRGVTDAGPGESNHNFGMAVDLGFDRLRWLRENGAVVENETSWLHRLDPEQRAPVPEALRFWEALRNVGTSAEVAMFRGPMSDRPHLQNWNDAGVDMAARLADLLTRSGTMRWTGRLQRYQCDLGLGGNFFDVGSAAQIWNRQATITIDMLTRARAAQQRPGGPPRQLVQPQRAGVGRAGGNQPAMQPQRVTQADVTAMQRELRRQFELADANWQNWTPR
jgi:hypothetical protein